MKIAVISDIHDNLANLKKFLNWAGANDIKEAVCCGDVTNADTLEYLAKNFNRRGDGQAGAIHLVRGNMEIYDESEVEKYSNIYYLGRFGATMIGGRRAGVCHEPAYIKEVIASCSKDSAKKKTANPTACDIIFYGHTHKPWLEKIDGITAVNTGTLGGVFQKATFAVWEPETGKLELKLLENV
ncbi:MAG: metallophosphoesterase family protein [Patescibacteria group bacterium]|jgi:hypothetical protein